jgi:hypothetical protein
MSGSVTGSWWQRRLPNVFAAATRFPLAVAVAALLTLYKFTQSELGPVELRVIGALVASFLWVVVVDLFVESQKQSQPVRFGLWFAGLLLIGVLFWFEWEIWLSPPLVVGGLLLLVGLSAHLASGKNNAAFWLFNHRLWLGAALALVGAVLFGAGLSAIHATLNLLFGLDLSSRWYEHIWTLSLAFVAPVSFLAFAPRNFADPITAREEHDFTMRAAAALVRFVLVPLLLVYTAILYAYAVKIALAWELPKGTLAGMVVGYLFVGAVTLLLGYPTREAGGPHVRFFWRNWVWLTALPVLLLFIAASRRIADYGLTEERYLIVLIGVWALTLAAFRLARGGDFDLRLMPGVLAFLLLAASFGPGGAIGFSVMNQKAELAAILQKQGMLTDGKFVPAGQIEQPPLGRHAARAGAIVSYLNTHHALTVLAPWFEGAANDPFAPANPPVETLRDLLAALGVSANIALSGGKPLNFSANAPAMFSVPAEGVLVGPVEIRRGSGAEPRSQSLSVDSLGILRVELSARQLTASLGENTSLVFDLVEAVKALQQRGLSAGEQPAVELKGAAQGLTGRAIIDRLNAYTMGTEWEIVFLRAWLVLERPG